MILGLVYGCKVTTFFAIFQEIVHLFLIIVEPFFEVHFLSHLIPHSSIRFLRSASDGENERIIFII